MTQVTFADAPGRAALDTDVLLSSFKAAPSLPFLPITQDAVYAFIPGAAAPDQLATSGAAGAMLTVLPDALGRLTWLDGSGAPVDHGIQTDSAGAAPFQIPTLTSADAGINGKPAMLCQNVRCGIYHVDPASAGAQLVPNLNTLADELTDAYCEIVVFAGPAGQTGRVFGQAANRDGNETDIADAGSGFGFLASANAGQMLYQHRADAGEATSANRVVFACALGDWAPTLAVIRCQPSGGAHAGEVRVASGGVTTVQPFSFAEPLALSGPMPWTFTGVLSNTIKGAGVNTNERKVTYRSRLNHYPTDAEMTRIMEWFATNYGPF